MDNGPTRQADGPLVCIIVLNYNGRRHLEYCLPSIAATEYTRLQVVVVDNASSDDSQEYVQRAHPDVSLVRSEENRGWSGGNNLGIEQARRLGAEFIALANNDIRVDSRWIVNAVHIARSDPHVGIIGFQILEPQQPGDTTAFRQAVDAWSGLEQRDTTVVDGMAMFIRSQMLDHIGLIDEGFFAYAEDNDLVLRARKAGYRVVQINAPIWHHGQGTVGKRLLWAASMQIRNNLRLSIKHDSPGGMLYQWLRLLAKGCLPFVKIDTGDQVARRLRPSNVVVNFGIWAYASAWNAWNLPATLRRRREDERRVQATRRFLGTS